MLRKVERKVCYLPDTDTSPCSLPAALRATMKQSGRALDAKFMVYLYSL